jgi:hypothetical protein
MCLYVSFRFELYERNHGRGRTDKEYSIRLSLSEGAHSSNVLDSALDARHSLNVQPRKYVFTSTLYLFAIEADCAITHRKLTQHLPYSLVIERLSKHFGRAVEVRFALRRSDAVNSSVLCCIGRRYGQGNAPRAHRTSHFTRQRWQHGRCVKHLGCFVCLLHMIR